MNFDDQYRLLRQYVEEGSRRAKNEKWAIFPEGSIEFGVPPLNFGLMRSLAHRNGPMTLKESNLIRLHAKAHRSFVIQLKGILRKIVFEIYGQHEVEYTSSLSDALFWVFARSTRFDENTKKHPKSHLFNSMALDHINRICRMVLVAKVNLKLKEADDEKKQKEFRKILVSNVDISKRVRWAIAYHILFGDRPIKLQLSEQDLDRLTNLFRINSDVRDAQYKKLSDYFLEIAKNNPGLQKHKGPRNLESMRVTLTNHQGSGYYIPHEYKIIETIAYRKWLMVFETFDMMLKRYVKGNRRNLYNMARFDQKSIKSYGFEVKNRMRTAVRRSKVYVYSRAHYRLVHYS